MIAALHRLERFEAVDEGLAGMARATADLLDEAIAGEQKLYAIAAAGRLHLSVTLALLHRFPVEQPGEDDGISELLGVLQDPKWLATDASDEVGGYRLADRPPGWDGD
jgi:hypothetical protein